MTHEQRLRLIYSYVAKVREYTREDTSDAERAFKELLVFILEHSDEAPMTAAQILDMDCCGKDE